VRLFFLEVLVNPRVGVGGGWGGGEFKRKTICGGIDIFQNHTIMPNGIHVMTTQPKMSISGGGWAPT